MPGQPHPPPGDRPPPPSTNRGGGGSSLRLSDRMQGGSDDSTLDSDESRGEMQLSSQPSTPPSPSDFAGSRRLSVGSAGRGSPGSDFKPPPPLGASFGGSETAVRTRMYRSTNAFALRVLEDEKAEQDLPKIARVQACFRGNQCRKKLRIERAIANSYGGLAGDGSEIAPHYLVSHMPTEQQVAMSRARFATRSGDANVHGKAGKDKHNVSKYLVGPASGKHSQHKKRQRHRSDEGDAALPCELRSRFTDLAAVPERPFRHRKRKVVRRKPLDGVQGKNTRTSDERFPMEYTRVAYASLGCWLALCIVYTTQLGVSFDLPTTILWAITLVATIVWQALVQGPMVVAVAVLAAPTLERVRAAWYHLMHYVPFQI